MNVTLHRSVGNETGWNAWCLDFHGFATWGPTESEVLLQVPHKLQAHCAWRASHGQPCPPCPSDPDVIERISGNEILFAADRHPASPELVDLTVRLLQASRRDLLSTVEELPPGAFDWDPPYRAFASWATWRSIRQILTHLANTETHYYLAKIGYPPRTAAARDDEDWRVFLPRLRRDTLDRLDQLRNSADRLRISLTNDDEWSAAKVLRRLVRHELLHWKSILRIGHDFNR